MDITPKFRDRILKEADPTAQIIVAKVAKIQPGEDDGIYLIFDQYNHSHWIEHDGEDWIDLDYSLLSTTVINWLAARQQQRMEQA